MIRIYKNEICTALKNSEFYRNQLNENEEGIFIHPSFYKTNGSIEERLKTYHFWNVDKLPDDCIEYLLSGKESEQYQEVREMPFSTIEEKVKTLKELKYTGDYYFLKDDRNEIIIYSGNLEQLKTINISDSIQTKCINIFAQYGYLDCLKYAHENGWFCDEVTCLYAAQNGHLECLKFAHENEYFWDEATCAYAAKNGHLECLKYAHEHGCPWNEYTCLLSAESGHLECLKYAHKNGCP